MVDPLIIKSRENIVLLAQDHVDEVIEKLDQARNVLIGVVHVANNREALGWLQQEYEERVLRPVAKAVEAMKEARGGCEWVFDKKDYVK